LMVYFALSSIVTVRLNTSNQNLASLQHGAI